MPSISMPSAFLQSVFDSPQCTTPAPFDDFDELISIKEEPDDFFMSPLRFQGLEDYAAMSTSPCPDLSTRDSSCERSLYEGDTSTSSNCPETPPSQFYHSPTNARAERNCINKTTDKQRKFLRDILISYEDEDTAIRRSPSPSPIHGVSACNHIASHL